MRYYLAGWAGTGTADDPFRIPEAAGVIDLRPDASKRDGFALAAFTAPPADTSLLGVDLGDDPAARLPPLTRKRVENALSVAALDDVAMRRIVTNLLVLHGDDAKPTRWNRLRAMRDSRYRVYLAGLLDEVAVPSGGASIAESFNRADAGGLGPDLAWNNDPGVGDRWQTTSNEARLTDANVGSSGFRTVPPRDTHNLATADHYAEVAVMNLPSADAGGNYGGVVVRSDATGATSYEVAIRHSGGVINATLAKTVAGTRTFLTGVAATYTAGDVVRGEINGSTLRNLINGVAQASVTDTSITGNLLPGVFIRNRSGSLTSVVTIDNFAAADVGGGGAVTGQPRVRLAGVFGQKPALVKLAGVFVEKPVRVRKAGTFTDAT